MGSVLKNILGILLVLVLSIGIIGCKEEDDTTVNTNPPVSDTIPPTILSVSPGDSSTDIQVDSSISITFSESVNPGSVTTNTSDSVCSGSLQVSLDEFSSCVQMSSDPSSETDYKVFLIKPSTNLGFESTYKIKVTTGVKDISGNPLGEEFVQNSGFTTVSVTDSTTDTDSTTNSTSDDVPVVYGFSIGPISGNTTELGGVSTFTVKLKSQPTDDVTIGFSSNDTTEGDVSPSSLIFTSVNWNVEQTVTVTGVDDLELDGNQSYSIVLSGVSSNDSNYNGLNPDDVFVINSDDKLEKITDTGQTTCYDVEGFVITCTSSGESLYGQDSNYSTKQLSFTDNTGELEGTVTDNNTFLLWQQSDDNNTYSWSGSQTYCNGLDLGDKTDWRVPNIYELVSIIDLSESGPFINSIFTGTKSSHYWASNEYSGSVGNGWAVRFDDSQVSAYDNSGLYYVRCVRGNSLGPPNFTDNGNQTITDNSTGLIWQKGEGGFMNWSESLTYCEGLTLGGESDWRLPNFREIQSLVDVSKYSPSIDDTFFPGVTGYYNSSTTSSTSTSSLFGMSSTNGSVSWWNKDSDSYVRCVRGGL